LTSVWWRGLTTSLFRVFALYRTQPARAHSRSVGTRKTIPAGDISAALRRLAAAIAERHRNTQPLLLLGIANAGVPVARRLARLVATALGREILEGVLNVAFHRDDIGRHPIPREAPQTNIPADLEGATVILVDAVLFSGRTARAALEELFANGRPERVELAVLVDRCNRRLPIAPDFTGFVEPTSPDERVTVSIAADAESPEDGIVITAG
jgi:pyrimidine operon attenuation protein / uracil phosphoribosyltransferase